MTFPRGFKTRCEGLATQIRHRLGVPLGDAFQPEKLAEHLAVTLWSVHDLEGLSEEVRGRLEGACKDEWSAVTIMAGARPVIVFNSSHSRRRRASTLMHELAHIVLDHTPGNMFFGTNGIALRTYDLAQESEADWLAGCLLLPRDSLLAARRQGLSDEAICERHVVSREMLRFRLNKTGVDRQLHGGMQQGRAVVAG